MTSDYGFEFEGKQPMIISSFHWVATSATLIEVSRWGCAFHARIPCSLEKGVEKTWGNWGKLSVLHREHAKLKETYLI